MHSEREHNQQPQSSNRQARRAARLAALKEEQQRFTSHEHNTHDKHVCTSVAAAIQLLHNNHGDQLKNPDFNPLKHITDELIKYHFLQPEDAPPFLEKLTKLAQRQQDDFDYVTLVDKDGNEVKLHLPMDQVIGLVICALGDQTQFDPSLTYETRLTDFFDFIQNTNFDTCNSGWRNDFVKLLHDKYKGIFLLIAAQNSLAYLMHEFYSQKFQKDKATTTPEAQYALLCQWVDADHKPKPRLDETPEFDRLFEDPQPVRKHLEQALKQKGLNTNDNDVVKLIDDNVYGRESAFPPSDKEVQFLKELWDQQDDLPPSVRAPFLRCTTLAQLTERGLDCAWRAMQLLEKTKKHLDFISIGQLEGDLKNCATKTHKRLSELLETNRDWSEFRDEINYMDDVLSQHIEASNQANGADILGSSFAILKTLSDDNPKGYYITLRDFYQRYRRANIDLLTDKELLQWLSERKALDANDTTVAISPAGLNQLVWQAITTSPMTWSDVFINTMDAVCRLLKDEQPGVLKSFIKSSFPKPFKKQLRWLVNAAKTKTVDRALPLYLPVNLANLPLKWHDLNGYDQHGFTLLHVLAHMDQSEWFRHSLPSLSPEDMRTLLYQGDFSCESGALHWAARWGHTDTVLVILSLFNDPEDVFEFVIMNDKENKTALHWAAIGGHKKSLTDLLSVIMDNILRAKAVMAQDLKGLTSFHLAAANGHTEAAITLLNAIQVTPLKLKLMKKQDRHNRTALHLAAAKGHTEIIRTVMSTEISPELSYEILLIQDIHGLTPLHYAAGLGHTKTVSALLKAARHNPQRLVLKKNRQGQSSLHMAAQKGKTETTCQLLSVFETPEDRYLALSDVDKLNRTAVHLAAEKGQTGTVVALLNSVDNPKNRLQLLKIKDKNGKTPLHLAVENGHTDTALTLLNILKNLELEIEPEMKTSRNNKARSIHKVVDLQITHWIGNTRDDDTLPMLLRTNKKVYADPICQLLMEVDSDNRTVLQRAVENGDTDIAIGILNLCKNPEQKQFLLIQPYKPGKGALYLAEKNGHTDLASILRETLLQIDPQEFPMPPHGIVGQTNDSLFRGPEQPVEQLESALKRARLSPNTDDNQTVGIQNAPGAHKQANQ